VLEVLAGRGLTSSRHWGVPRAPRPLAARRLL
jgi:hypothetical protein